MEWKQERPTWCPHIGCTFKRRVQEAFCSGKLYEPSPHNADFNYYRICFNCLEDGSLQDYQVNDTDLEYLRWTFDALDGKETSWLSKRKEVIMPTEFDLTVRFCPQCKQERASLNEFCGKCGTRIQKLDLILHMEETKVTRVIIKGQD